MTPTSGRSYALSRASRWVALVVLVLVLTLAMTSVAVAVVDEFGGASFTALYAPYTAGPVVSATEPEPYAPYTAGPVVREVRPYAPYTAGPVVEKEAAAPERIGNYLLR